MHACAGIRVWFWVTHPSAFIWTCVFGAVVPHRVLRCVSLCEVVPPALTWSLWSSAAFMARSVSLGWHAAPWNMDAVSHRSALQQQNAPVLTDAVMLYFSVHVLHVSSILSFPKAHLCTPEYRYKIAYKYLLNTAGVNPRTVTPSCCRFAVIPERWMRYDYIYSPEMLLSVTWTFIILQVETHT